MQWVTEHRNFDLCNKMDHWPVSRDKVWCVTGLSLGVTCPADHHLSRRNKQTDVTSPGQVRANTRGISGQLPGAWDLDKLETTGSSLSLWSSLIMGVTCYSEQHRPWWYGNRSPLDHLGWISSCYIWIIHKTSLRRLSTSSDTHTSGGAIGCCKLDLLTADIGFKMEQDGPHRALVELKMKSRTLKLPHNLHNVHCYTINVQFTQTNAPNDFQIFGPIDPWWAWSVSRDTQWLTIRTRTRVWCEPGMLNGTGGYNQKLLSAQWSNDRLVFIPGYNLMTCCSRSCYPVYNCCCEWDIMSNVG